jgi:glycosyl transferase family 87
MIVVPLIALGVAVALTPHTSDFQCLWTGSRFVLDGRDPYDTVAWTDAMSGQYVDAFGTVRPTFCPGRYGYPLTTAIALLPLGGLPIGIAAATWEVLLMTGAVLGTVLVWRALEGPNDGMPTLLLFLLGSQPLWNTVMNAQFGGLLLGVLGIVLYLIVRRPGASAAGVAAALLLLKPHIFGLVALLTWSRRKGRPFAAFVATSFLLFVAAFAARPSWPGEWLAEALGSRLAVASVATSTWTLAAWLTGGRVLAVLVIAGLTVASVVLVLRRRLSVVQAAALLGCMTLVVTPYAGSHDQLLLVPAWAVLLERALARNDRLSLALLPLVVLVLPWVLYALRDQTSGLEIPSAIMPIIASVLLLTSLHRFAKVGNAQATQPHSAATIKG